jgi:hypothetical protein
MQGLPTAVRVQGLRCGVQRLRCGVQGLRCGVQGLRCGVQGLRCALLKKVATRPRAPAPAMFWHKHKPRTQNQNGLCDVPAPVPAGRLRTARGTGTDQGLRCGCRDCGTGYGLLSQLRISPPSRVPGPSPLQRRLLVGLSRLRLTSRTALLQIPKRLQGKSEALIAAGSAQAPKRHQGKSEALIAAGSAQAPKRHQGKSEALIAQASRQRAGPKAAPRKERGANQSR